MTPFYYVRTVEKVIIALLDMFNNVRVNKYTDLSRTTYTKTVAVPIVTFNCDDFANWYSTTVKKQPATPVPIMGLRMDNIQYDAANALQPCYAREIFSKASEKWIRDIQPTPYTLTFSLTALSDNLMDFNEINENILPYFNRYRTLRIREWDFAPEMERDIPVTLSSYSEELKDELTSSTSENQFYKSTYTLTCNVVLYRPFELPEMIRYAQMDFNVANKIIDSEQILVYPDAIAEQKRHLWETVEPSIREGYSLLKSLARTLVRRGTVNGEEYWEDETIQNIALTGQNKAYRESDGSYPVPDGATVIGEGEDNGVPYKLWEVYVDDVERPTQVPSFDLLHLTFDADRGTAADYSGLGRDFSAVNDSDRTFVPALPPGNGQNAPEGYDVASTVNWARILDWFGDNSTGTIESPYTFKATLQFTEDTPGDTVFQYLSNDETTGTDGKTIPAGTVWFDWGIEDSALYFTFHTSSLYRTFVSETLTLDSTTIYAFYFVLYKGGTQGMFGMKTNLSDTMTALTTTVKETEG